MNKKAIGKLMSMYWFAMIILVAGGVVYVAHVYYGAPYNVQTIESGIMEDQIENCLVPQGYINPSMFNDSFRENFLKYCHLNFSVEDAYGWKNNSEYYTEVNVYKFDGGNIGLMGVKLFNVSVGNPNLKILWQIASNVFSTSALSAGRKVSTIVIHSTEGSTTYGALETISNRQLSIHYLIGANGNVYSYQNPYYQFKDAFVSTNSIASHAGCGEGSDRIQQCSSNCIDPNGIGMPGLLDSNCQQLSGSLPVSQWCCIPNYNPVSVGIELVNLGNITGLCKLSSYKGTPLCLDAISAYGDKWENFSESQIDSLVNVVSGIAAVYNVPLDREHIIGHYQITTNKTDPGPAFPWNEFMKKLQQRGAVLPPSGGSSQGQVQRSFYAVDKDGNQYIVTVLALIGKNEKNTAQQ